MKWIMRCFFARSTTSEGTQNTEDTVEDMDKDMSVDESSQLGKTHDMCLLKDQMSMELSENTRELIMDEAAKILCKVCLGNMARNKDNVPEVLICCSQCSSTSTKKILFLCVCVISFCANILMIFLLVFQFIRRV